MLTILDILLLLILCAQTAIAGPLRRSLNATTIGTAPANTISFANGASPSTLSSPAAAPSNIVSSSGIVGNQSSTIATTVSPPGSANVRQGTNAISSRPSFTGSVNRNNTSSQTAAGNGLEAGNGTTTTILTLTTTVRPNRHFNTSAPAFGSAGTRPAQALGTGFQSPSRNNKTLIFSQAPQSTTFFVLGSSTLQVTLSTGQAIVPTAGGIANSPTLQPSSGSTSLFGTGGFQQSSQSTTFFVLGSSTLQVTVSTGQDTVPTANAAPSPNSSSTTTITMTSVRFSTTTTTPIPSSSFAHQHDVSSLANSRSAAVEPNTSPTAFPTFTFSPTSAPTTGPPPSSSSIDASSKALPSVVTPGVGASSTSSTSSTFSTTTSSNVAPGVTIVPVNPSAPPSAPPSPTTVYITVTTTSAIPKATTAYVTVTTTASGITETVTQAAAPASGSASASGSSPSPGSGFGNDGGSGNDGSSSDGGNGWWGGWGSGHDCQGWNCWRWHER